MNYQTILFDIAETTGVATITLNRPARMNALTAELKNELADVVSRLENDNSVRVAVITGAGEKAFCAGADIRERHDESPNPAEFHRQQRKTHDIFNAIESLAVPVIAAINGVALGGGLELALACDLRIATSSAVLGLTEVGLGLIPAAGGTQRLPRIVGLAKAKELMFTAARLTAGEALAVGLVNRVAESSALEEATNLAEQIAAKPPLAVQFAKRTIDHGMRTDVRSALEFELYAAAILFDTDDRKEGMKAFVEKRTPHFLGR
jgi:enoyl-CoA hydratase